MKKALLSILFILMAVCSWAYDACVDGIYYNFSGNEAEVTSLSSTFSENGSAYTGDVVIPETVTYEGVTYSVTSIEVQAFANCQGLTSVKMPNSVTSIGESAFFYCKNMVSANISESVTTIGLQTFSECNSLTSLTIPNSVISIGQSAFMDCVELTSLTIPNSVISIGQNAFTNCQGLTSVTIPNSVTNVGSYTFSGCIGLTSVTIPNSITNMGSQVFAWCENVNEVNISLKDEDDLANYLGRTNIGDIFYSGLSEKAHNILINGVKQTSITIPNSVTNIGSYAFSNCTGLTSITIPESVTSIGSYAFDGCSNVKELIYSEGTKVILCTGLNSMTSVMIPNTATSIENNAFNGCTGLTSITIPSSVTSIGRYAFYNCTGFPVIDNMRYADTYLIGAADKDITSANIKDGTKWIGTSAFYGYTSLASVTIPESVTSYYVCKRKVTTGS